MYTNLGQKFCDRCNQPLNEGQVVVLKYQGPATIINNTELCINDDTSIITVEHLNCEATK